MIAGVPLGELAWLAAIIVAGGVLAGFLAGLFGIGGGAIIVPVLYEVFRIIGVPDEVRMQLCIGTSLAIIVPTTIRSYQAHRARGAVLPEVLRIWMVPMVVGVGVGAALAAVRAAGACSSSRSSCSPPSSRRGSCSAATAGGSATSCPGRAGMVGLRLRHRARGAR